MKHSKQFRQSRQFRRIFCMLMLAACLLGAACAETLPPLTVVTPAPTAAPVGTEFSCEAFIVRLPYGLEIADEENLAGYEAAVGATYSDAGLTQLVATNAAGDAAVCFALMDSTQTPADAAREAARNVLGSDETVTEPAFGTNSSASFACAAEDTAYCFYYFSNGQQLLMVSISGLEEAEINAMLASLIF